MSRGFSVAAAVKAADTAVKSAAVSMMNLRIGTGIGGKSFVVISGRYRGFEIRFEGGFR